MKQQSLKQRLIAVGLCLLATAVIAVIAGYIWSAVILLTGIPAPAAHDPEKPQYPVAHWPWHVDRHQYYEGPVLPHALIMLEVYDFDGVTGRLWHWDRETNTAYLQCSPADFVLDGELTKDDWFQFLDYWTRQDWRGDFHDSDPPWASFTDYDILAYLEVFADGPLWTGGAVKLDEVELWRQIEPSKARVKYGETRNNYRIRMRYHERQTSDLAEPQRLP